MAEGAGYCIRERRQAHSPPDSACGQEIWILQKIQIASVLPDRPCLSEPDYFWMVITPEALHHLLARAIKLCLPAGLDKATFHARLVEVFEQKQMLFQQHPIDTHALGSAAMQTRGGQGHLPQVLRHPWQERLLLRPSRDCLYGSGTVGAPDHVVAPAAGRGYVLPNLSSIGPSAPCTAQATA